MGRTAKAYIAVLVEDTDWMPVFKKETTRKGIFRERILVRFNKAFPMMFRIIRRYYLKHGRALTEKEFENVVYGRMQNMFDFSMATKTLIKSAEHPTITRNKKMRRAYRRARLLFRRGGVYQRKVKK